jgi:hypothetical protein
MPLRALLPFALLVAACHLPEPLVTPEAATPRSVLDAGHAHGHEDHHQSGPGGGVQPMPSEGLGPRHLPTSATADSSDADHPASLTIDTNQTTYWASAGPKTNAQVTLAFPSRQTFRWVLLKTGPLPEGVTFKFMVSDDGQHWQPGYGRTTNSTWEMQLQDIQGAGKYLRVWFFSRLAGPPTRFMLHEIEVYGGALAP